jgi:hypothetical protein
MLLDHSKLDNDTHTLFLFLIACHKSHQITDMVMVLLKRKFSDFSYAWMRHFSWKL